MIRYLPLILLVFSSKISFAQEMNGRVYADDKPLEAALIQNITQNRQALTDADGYFSLSGRLNDSVVISAAEFATQYLKVKDHHLNEVWVIEMTEDFNALDEVRIFSNKEEEQAFSIEEYNSSFNAAIDQDRKENPHLYRPPGAQQGIDFIQLAVLLIDLIKKDKEKAPVYEALDYKDLQQLFETDTFFNEELLRKQLQIPKEYEILFFDFCTGSGLTEEMLLKENQLQLLDFLIKQSTAYQQIIIEASRE